MKKFLAIIIAGAMLFLCGCSSRKTSNPTNSSTPEDTSSSEKVPKKVFLLTDEMRYTAKGEPWYKNTYTYDDAGRMTSHNYVRFAYDDTDEFSYTQEYSYNEKGYLCAFNMYGDESGSFQCQYSYSSDGKVYSASFGTYRILYFYDDEGRVVRVTDQKGDGTTRELYSCTYDESGRVLTVVKDGIPYGFTYDDMGRIVKAIGHNWVSYAYEQNGVVRKTINDGILEWQCVYTNGLLSEIIMETDSLQQYGETAPRSYILDEYGKITRIQYDSGGRIEYHYKELDVTRDENDLRYVYFNELNQPMRVEDYYLDVMSFVLPKAEVFEVAS